MAYTITITFSAETINSAGDSLQLILTMDVNTTGTNESYSNSDKSLLVEDYGSVQWDWDLEDTLLVPGQVTMKIVDSAGYLDGLLFGTDSVAQAVDKQFKVELQLNSVVEFSGYVLEETIFSNMEDSANNKFLITFSAAPKIDILNKTMIYDDDGLFLDPLDYTPEDLESISNATYSSAEVTITHSSNTNINIGDSVRIKSVVGMDDLNGVRVVTDDTSSTETHVSFSTSKTYTSGGSLQKLSDPGSYVKFTTIIEEIYQLINTSISYAGGDIEFYHDWEIISAAGASTIIDATYAAGVVTIEIASSASYSPGDRIWIEGVVGMTDLNAEFTVNTVPDGTHITVVLTTAQTYTSGGEVREIVESGDIEDIYQIIGPLYFDNTGPQTVGELLRKLAIDWFSFTGMINNDRVFFKKLFRYDSGNTQSLGQVNKFEKSNKYQLIDYVKVTVQQSGDRTYEAGTFTNISTKILTRDKVIPGFFEFTSDGGSNLQFVSNTVTHAKDTNVDSAYNAWYANGYLLAQLWYQYRGSLYYNRVDHFEVVGIDYDFLKDFTYDSNKYQIIGMKKRWADNITEIDAIFLGP